MLKKTIMIVDDSASSRKELKLTLSEAGYEVLEACDGADARSKLTGQPIHLLIYDLAMPNRGSMEFLYRLRLLATYRFTPVIVLSSDNCAEKSKEGREIAVQAWIGKPFQPELLISAVSKLISIYRTDCYVIAH